MKVSTRGDYAVRVMLELALAPPGTVISLSQLAQRTGVPAKYTVQLLKALQPKGVIRSHRGANGGFSLGRAAADITVAEVLRIMDGPLAPVACASQTIHIPCSPRLCQSEENCVLREMWLDVRNAIAEILDNTTFADLAQRRRLSPRRRGRILDLRQTPHRECDRPPKRERSGGPSPTPVFPLGRGHR
jgi:Rrf2 family protein